MGSHVQIALLDQEITEGFQLGIPETTVDLESFSVKLSKTGNLL